MRDRFVIPTAFAPFARTPLRKHSIVRARKLVIMERLHARDLGAANGLENGGRKMMINVVKMDHIRPDRSEHLRDRPSGVAIPEKRGRFLHVFRKTFLRCEIGASDEKTHVIGWKVARGLRGENMHVVTRRALMRDGCVKNRFRSAEEIEEFVDVENFHNDARSFGKLRIPSEVDGRATSSRYTFTYPSTIRSRE